MDAFDQAALFRNALKKRNLMLHRGYGAKVGEQINRLDLNMGEIACFTSDLQAVYDCAAEFFQPFSGEHTAIAQLVCATSDMDNAVRYWHRPYHVDAKDHPEKWVRMSTLIDHWHTLKGK